MTHSKGIRMMAFMTVVVLLLSILSVAFAYNTIPYGEQSDQVRKMQKALKGKGYYRGAVDGKFGPATKSAVRKYQAAIGLHNDGKPGDKTLTALYEGVSKLNRLSDGERLNTQNITNPRSLYYGCTGSRVRSLQRALRSAGYFKGTVDGVYGDATLAAVKRYQGAHGLHADGIAGTKTIASLNRNTKVKISNGMLLAEGSTGDEVKKLQLFLNAQVASTPGMPQAGNTDGFFDRGTTDALKAWQNANGQSATGAFNENEYNHYIVQ